MNTVEIWLSSLLLLFSLQQWLLPIIPSHATTTQAELLHSFITSNFISPNNTNNNLPHSEEWPDELHQEHLLPSSSSSSSVYIGPQQGLMNADKIDALPGQPPGVKFGQYSGYVTVDPRAGRSLFYYLAESPKNSSGKPLVLWLTGGPGCTTLGFFEIGPYKVRSDGKTLYMDDHAWNNVANVLFVESPAGVGFSYSNTTSDYETTGDRRTAKDSYTFLVNWFQRFPHYKNRDFYIAGQSYCGHFIPQLAHNIVTRNNENSGLPFINLKGIAVGNGLLDSNLVVKGIADFLLLELRNQDNMDSLKGA